MEDPNEGPLATPKFLVVCTVCQGPIAEKGPPIQSFSFGQLFKRGQKSMLEKALLSSEFPGSNGGRRRYDTSKTLSTPCGHLFHSGCLREWFYVQRDSETAPLIACPYCQQRITLSKCHIVYPSTIECSLMFKKETHSLGVGTESSPPAKEVIHSDTYSFAQPLKNVAVSIIFGMLLIKLFSQYLVPYFTKHTDKDTKEEETRVPESEWYMKLSLPWSSFVVGCILAISKARNAKSKERGWTKAILATTLFLFAIYCTFEDDLSIFDFGDVHEVNEDEDLDKISGMMSSSWTQNIGFSFLLSCVIDALL